MRLDVAVMTAVAMACCVVVFVCREEVVVRELLFLCDAESSET
jgi:hypothetical protein